MEKYDNETLKKLQKTELEILDDVVKVCEKNNIEYCLVGGTLLGAIRHKGFIPWDDDIDIGMFRTDFNKSIKVSTKELSEKYYIEYKDFTPNYYLNFIKIMKKNTLLIEKDKVNYEGNKGIFIDIFPLDNANNEKSLIQSFQFISSSFIRRLIFSRVAKRKQVGIKKVILKCFEGKSNKQLLDFQEKIMTLNKNDNSKYITIFAGAYNYKKDTYLREKIYPYKEALFEQKKYSVPNDSDYYLKHLYGDYMRLPPMAKRYTHQPVKIEF